jgi:hypothetical protein
MTLTQCAIPLAGKVLGLGSPFAHADNQSNGRLIRNLTLF